MIENKQADANNNPVSQEQQQLIQLITTLLVTAKIPVDLEIPSGLFVDPDFQKLHSIISDLRELTSALCKGDLHKFVYNKGYILSNLKALQSNLRHLTWQTKKVSEGDFSQRIDFLGDFSDAFNEMTIKLRDSSMQLHRLATVDVLTQIPNRMALEQFLANAFEKAKEHSQDFCVFVIDVDHFKLVNDTYGHIVGDKVLVQLTNILNKQFRATDFFARYGGEEFVAGLPGSNLENAERIAWRALRAVESTQMLIDEVDALSVTISIGISQMMPSDETYTDMIKRGDIALYNAKKSGRNRVCVAL